MISEVGPTGKKQHTYVLNGTNRIASQREWVYNSSTYEAVTFTHSDASGMSQREAYSNGEVIGSGGNYDGSPVESDPMGGNMGTETPYVEDPPDPPPPDDQFPYPEANGFFPTMVNGQAVGMTLDGIRLIGPVAEGWLGFGRDPRAIAMELMFFSASMSSRVVGVRDRGVRWGQPFTADYNFDGTRHYWFGDFDPALSQVSYANSSLIFDSNWSSINLLTFSQQRRGPKLDPLIPQNLRQLVSDLANRTPCADILSKFFSVLAKNAKSDPGKTLVETTFDNLKEIVVDDERAGSGAMTNGSSIWVRRYQQLGENMRKALYATNVLSELLHSVGKGRSIRSDAAIDDAARKVLKMLDPKEAERIQNHFFTGGKSDNGSWSQFGHYLMKQYCRYSDDEVK